MEFKMNSNANDRILCSAVMRKLELSNLTEKQILDDIKAKIEKMDKTEAINKGLKNVNIDDIIYRYQSIGYAFQRDDKYLFYDQYQIEDLVINHQLNPSEIAELTNNRIYYLPIAEHITKLWDCRNLPLIDRLEIAYLLEEGGEYDTKAQLTSKLEDEVVLYAKLIPEQKLKRKAFLVMDEICGIDIKAVRSLAQHTEKIADGLNKAKQKNKLTNIRK